MASEHPLHSPPPAPCQRSPGVATTPKCKLKDAKPQEKLSRHITRKILAATEAVLWPARHRLRDEIAQALLGIHDRLFVSKQEALTAQRRVNESVQTLRRHARKAAIPDENPIP